MQRFSNTNLNTGVFCLCLRYSKSLACLSASDPAAERRCSKVCVSRSNFATTTSKSAKRALRSSSISRSSSWERVIFSILATNGLNLFNTQGTKFLIIYAKKQKMKFSHGVSARNRNRDRQKFMLKLWVIVLEGPGLNAATAARSPGGTEVSRMCPKSGSR